MSIPVPPDVSRALRTIASEGGGALLLWGGPGRKQVQPVSLLRNGRWGAFVLGRGPNEQAVQPYHHLDLARIVDAPVTVSRVHAYVRRSATASSAEWEVVHASTKRATYVIRDGTALPLRDAKRLRHGDAIVLGDPQRLEECAVAWFAWEPGAGRAADDDPFALVGTLTPDDDLLADAAFTDRLHAVPVEAGVVHDRLQAMSPREFATVDVARMLAARNGEAAVDDYEVYKAFWAASDYPLPPRTKATYRRWLRQAADAMGVPSGSSNRLRMAANLLVQWEQITPAAVAERRAQVDAHVTRCAVSGRGPWTAAE
jgi:hypothetical protein